MFCFSRSGSLSSFFACSELPLYLFLFLNPTFTLTNFKKAAIPFWAFMAKRYGKKQLYVIGSCIFICTLIGLWFVPRGKIGFFNLGTVIALFFMCFLAGLSFSCVAFIPHGKNFKVPLFLFSFLFLSFFFDLISILFYKIAIFPDVIELDELETGERREGLFYSFFVFFQKAGLSFALAGSNYVLAIVGFRSSTDDNPYVQPPAVIVTLSLMLSFVPAVIFALSLIPLYFYPISKEKHQETLRLLRERKLKATSTNETSDSVSLDVSDVKN